MKTCFRTGWLVIVLSLIWLLAGCVSQSSAYRRQPLHDFEVVETSTKRELTTREMAYLRAKVADYLVQQGEIDSGDYYVKIYLGEEDGVQEGDWVVVRFTRYPSAQLTVVDAYPGSTYPSYLHYNYDYLPFGWFGFSALSFRYFDDPYYYGHGFPSYYPRWPHARYTGYWRDHNHDHKNKPHYRPDRDRDHGKDKDRRRDHDRSGHKYSNRSPATPPPSYVPPQTDRTRWNNRDRSNGNRPTFDRQRRDNRGNGENRDVASPRSEDRPRWRDRQANNPSSTGTSAPVNRFAPGSNPASTVATPASRPVTRPDYNRQRGPSESGRIVRPQNNTNTSTAGQRIVGRERSSAPGTASAPSSIRPNRTSEGPRTQPAYTPPPPRAESRSESRSDDNGSRTNTHVSDGGRRARER